MRKSVLKRVLPPPYVCALAAFLLASCSLIQEMPKEFMDTYGNIAHVEKVEYEGLAEGGGDTPLVTETRDFRIIYTISNTGDFDLAPEFSFEGCEAEIKKIETEKYRIALTVSGESLATLEDGAALKVKLLLYMAKQKILQSAYEIDMLYVRTGPPAEAPNPGDTTGDVDPSNPGDTPGSGDSSTPGNPSGGDPSNPNAPEEPDEPLPSPEPGKIVYVRGKNAAWYEKNMPGAEASDENPGTEDAPFATIQRAVKEIIERNDGESVYAIYIDGTLECDARTYTGAQGMADFSALEKDLTLTIKAISETATLDAGEKSRVIYAVPSSGSLNLMLEKLVIKGGNVEDGDGGGIYASGAVITMRDDVTITGNKARFGGGVYVDNNGTFTIKGGIIGSDSEDSGNKASHGGGVYIKKGTLTMSGSSTISGNTAEVEGGGVYIASIGAFNMSGGEISKNKTNDDTGDTSGGGGVYVYLNPDAGKDAQGAFTMTGGKVIENTSAKNGGGVYVNGGTFAMSDTATISGNTADILGGGVYAAGDSAFKMSGNSAISGNEAATSGGGVYAASSKTFTMTGGSITGNAANGTDNTSGGGGVYLVSGIFEMSGGTIGGSDSDKNTAKYGGGVYAAGDSAFKMSGNAAISGNEAATSGGGVYVVADGALTMEDGIIGSNTATTNGGGVCVTGGAFKMNGGKIKGNAANGGGGVSVHTGGKNNMTGGTFTMTGDAAISENEATNGGGVYVSQNGTVKCTFEMSGGEIGGNKATGNGNGVYVSNSSGTGSTFKMSGDAKVSEKNDVYLCTSLSNKSALITVAGKLSEGIHAKITLPASSYNSDMQVLSAAGTGVSIDEVCKQFAVTPNGSTEWIIMPSGGYGVLAKADVSTGDGITVTTTWGDVYEFEVKDGSNKVIGKDVSELQQNSTISLNKVMKNGIELTGQEKDDGTFTIEIQDDSKTRFENANNPPYNKGFNQPAHVPIVPYAMKAFVYVKAELKEGKTVETHIPVTIMPMP